MKKIGVLVSVALGLFVVSSCKRAAVDSKELDIVDSLFCDAYDDSLQLQTGLLEYDSICFSDGSVAVYRMNSAPQNTLVEYRNSKGKVIATVSRASECYGQVVIYRYDDHERLVHLVVGEGDLEGFDEESYHYWVNDETVSPYLAFRRQMEKLDYTHPDTLMYEQYDIMYDNNGEAVKVTKTLNSDEIKAPEGYKLEVSVEPCVNFWASDLYGGYYIFKVNVVPRKYDLSNYTIVRYADFIPAIEQNFKNGILERVVLYPDPSQMESKRVVVTREDKGNRHFYTRKIDDDIQTYQAEWSDGLLRYRQTVSPYGTVLKKVSYEYSLPSTRVKAVYKIIDYGIRKLKTDSVGYVEQISLGQEADEMNLMSLFGYWENQYDNDECLKVK